VKNCKFSFTVAFYSPGKTTFDAFASKSSNKNAVF
jgi:hypothetical protein